MCGHFANDSIRALRTTRFRFENDSISHLTDTSRNFRLDFFADFGPRKKSGGQIGNFRSLDARISPLHRGSRTKQISYRLAFQFSVAGSSPGEDIALGSFHGRIKPTRAAVSAGALRVLYRQDAACARALGGQREAGSALALPCLQKRADKGDAGSVVLVT